MDLQIRELSFSYTPEKTVFKNLSLDLSPGKMTFLLGANGSGKSTLLKLICGLYKPEKGTVCLDGRSLENFSALKRARHFGVMLQQVPPALDFTVEEVVLFGRSAKLPRLAPPRQKDKDAVIQALEKTGMLSYARRRANTLSGGEFQRVVLASVLALESEVLLFDEPVSAQDPAQAALLFGMLRRLAPGKNILVISHDLDLAARCGERIMLLADGKIFADGTPGEVLTPENLLKLYNVPQLSVARSMQLHFE